MATYQFEARSLRVAKAKLRRHVGKQGTGLALFGAGLLIVIGIVLAVIGRHLGLSLVGLGLMILAPAAWLRRDVLTLPAALFAGNGRLEQIMPADLVAVYTPALSATELWAKLQNLYECQFMMVRFGLPPDVIGAGLGSVQLSHDQLWQTASEIAAAAGLSRLSSASVMAALFAQAPALQQLLTSVKLEMADLAEGVAWLGRLQAFQSAPKPVYGGIARDWAAGFTPLLSQLGQNFSREIEMAGNRFAVLERTTQLDTLVTGLSSGTGSVVMIGEPGIGKTALLYGLADRLLQGKNSGALAHHQIFSLNATVIMSQTQRTGDLERTVMQLFNEAVHAGNIVLALDEAQLFFGQGAGAVNLSQILQPVLQARSLKLVLAVSPGDWQRLRATNPGLTSLLTPLVLVEPPQPEVMRLLADRALILERGQLITRYSALQEAYRLSGRYFPDEAYPGRALKLLEAATTYPEGQLITAVSVQKAIESQLGVKVQSANANEADVLLNLEDHIHERMINQTRAVSVVANALRRARAGVANPKRPAGSFLFLGPTGVGKTELAKSLAALYFGAEENIIRLDMSEYQQATDITRILADAATNPQGLLAKVRQQPFSVVLFDEIEKADSNILNLLLQLLDEGNLTDTGGKATSFKDTIVIATSNAGAEEIRKHIEAGEELEAFEEAFTNSLIDSGAFKPELLNRFDEIVLFRPLNEPELAQVVKLMIAEVNKTLANQKISVQLTDSAIAILVKAGYDPRLGARPMRRMVQRRVEDAVAGQILRGQAQAGAVITLDGPDVGGAATPVAPAAAPSAPIPTAPATQGEVLFDRSKANNDNTDGQK